MAMSHAGTDTVYVGTAPLTSHAHLFRTTNGGGSWDDVTGILPDRYPLDIAVDPADPSVVYVAFGGFNAPHLFRSTDAGDSWTDVAGLLPDVPATAVIIDPLNPTVVYVGTDIGMFVSSDARGGWSAWNNGFPEAVLISDLTISPTNRTIRAATHSNGVYERAMIDRPTPVADENAGTPLQFALTQNYPNPFNPSTVIAFEVAGGERTEVSLTIFDLLGREVGTLVHEELPGGSYTRTFRADGLASGVYYYTLKAGEFSETRKMVLVR
jgi:hypothetical protein